MLPVTKLRTKRLIPLLACMLFIGVISSYAQSLGEIARREREHKESQPAPSLRVYTNEDLARPRILDPEDRSRFQADRQGPTAAPPIRATEIRTPRPRLAEIPLGDVARHYRRLKQLRERRESAERTLLPGAATLA